MNTSLHYLLSLIIITSLSACNENSSDPIRATDTTKPQITLIDDDFAGFIIPPLTGEAPISVTPYPEKIISATDDSGITTLSISKVTGLELSQVSINSTQNISFQNIKHDTGIGAGLITIRATDKSGNYSERELLFGITPNILQNTIHIKRGESVTIKYPVMPNLDTISITQPNNSSGISASAYLANHEAFITFTASNNASIDEKIKAISEVTLSDKLDKSLTHSLNIALVLPSN